MQIKENRVDVVLVFSLLEPSTSNWVVGMAEIKERNL